MVFIIKLPMMMRLVLALCVVSSVMFTYSSAQTCSSYSFSANRNFSTCRDLPHQGAFLHWSYDQSSGKLEIAYRHGGISSTANRWVAWGINPNNNDVTAMPGTQALVALSESGDTGVPTVYTSPIRSSGDVSETQLVQGDISYNVTGLSAARVNDEVIIFATVMLPSGTESVVHVWQEGPLAGSTPQRHELSTEHTDSKETLDLVSGVTQAAASGDALRRKRNVHGVLNAVSWGTMLPLGAIIARYLKVFKSADPAWFYLHVICQTSAYIVGVGGWAYGLKLGHDSVAVQYDTHRALGITIFCLATLQVFALFLRPNKDHKYRIFWNFYHYLVGYATIIISIVNIFQGFDALENSYGDRYENWKDAYIGVIAALGGIALLLEVYTWVIVLKRKKSEGIPNGVNNNGVNGVNDGFESKP
ncbi:cytochrome b561 and DOMON domain-containing protein At5g47530-like [Neltuma alba]|uniref:cytochrome b561 and DOMON domain-containing protein At5g47530-like n=1 Tax=Neltuma alba TaxID=207710 RepID=UPI0010A4EA18|nr:cytochrome b561 and DOMON domain-containing protein At5g47530-like [Prosopis alba]